MFQRSGLLVVVISLAWNIVAATADDKSKFSLKGVTATGQSVELVAVVRMDQEERLAWRPDGTKIEISKKWGEITRLKGQNPTHGFVFRCQGFRKGQIVAWRDIRATPPVLTDTVPEFVNISATLTDDSPVKFRVGILEPWGPWQKIRPDGKPYPLKPVPKTHQRFYQMVKSGAVSYGKDRPMRTQFALLGVIDRKQIQDLVWHQVYAVDGEGRRVDFWGVVVWKGGPVPCFDLDEDDVAYFEYRMRPYKEWMTFENIPLKPGKNGRAKVTAKKVELPKPQ